MSTVKLGGLPVPPSHFLPCPWWQGAQKWKPSAQCIINSNDKIVREGVKWDTGGETVHCITFFNPEMALWAVSQEMPAVSYYVFEEIHVWVNTNCLHGDWAATAVQSLRLTAAWIDGIKGQRMERSVLVCCSIPAFVTEKYTMFRN